MCSRTCNALFFEGYCGASARKRLRAVRNIFCVGEVQLADEADDNFINVLQGVRRNTTNAYLNDDATFNALGVYSIMLDVFDGELLFPLLGDPFKAEPKPEDVPKLSLILDPPKSKVAPSNNEITNTIESDVRVVESHEQTRVGH